MSKNKPSDSSQEKSRREVSRGLVDNSSEPRFLVIGRITKPHGKLGEVRVEILSELPERFNWLEVVFFGEDGSKPVGVESVRFHKSWALLKLEGYDSRLEAERLRSTLLSVPEEEGIPLEEGEYYLYQLIGLSVYTNEGSYLGILQDVLETKANNVFIIEGDQKEILLPDIEEVVKDIDFQLGRMTVNLLPGLIPE
jgi:16S rRNA processing protein RimM